MWWIFNIKLGTFRLHRKQPMTETQTLLSLEQSLWQAEKNIKDKKISLSELAEVMPGILHLNDFEDFSLQFMNGVGCNLFEKETTELVNLGDRYLEDYIHPETRDLFFQILPKFISSDDEHKVISVFQKARFSTDSEYGSFYSNMKLWREENAIVIVSNPIDQLDEVANKLQRVIEENEFMKKNWQRFSSLTKREKEILALLALGYSTPMIADKLFLSPETVKTHRKNLKRKLEAKTLRDLMKYARAFDLV